MLRGRSGETIVVRSPQVGDAASLLELAVEVFSSCDYLGTDPAEMDRSISKEEERIREFVNQTDGLALIAVVDDRPVGRINFRANAKQRMAHHGHLGMYVHNAWRGRGVGRVLLESLIDWARAHPTIEMLCLGVMAPNEPAIRLYESVGFLREEWRTRQFKLGPGCYFDDIKMYLPVKAPVGRVEPGVSVEADLHAPPKEQPIVWARTSVFDGARLARLPNGSEITVRRPVENDAEPLIAHAHDVLSSSDHTATTLEEYKKTYDVPKERAWIAEMNAGEGTLALVADGPDGIVGMLSFRAEARRRMAHWGHFGIGVHSTWRGRGVGRALLTGLMDWAADHPTVEKVCLGVMAGNRGAYRLYHNLGFRAEGQRPREFKLGPDRYADDVQMSQYVKW